MFLETSGVLETFSQISNYETYVAYILVAWLFRT